MADPLPPDHGMHSLEAKYAWALAEITRLRLALSAMTQAKEKVEGHAIHGWSEEAHQRGHKEDYIAMLEQAESQLAEAQQVRDQQLGTCGDCGGPFVRSVRLQAACCPYCLHVDALRAEATLAQLRQGVQAIEQEIQTAAGRWQTNERMPTRVISALDQWAAALRALLSHEAPK